MPLVAWVTLVIATLIVAAAALGLIRVILHLKVIRYTLGTVVVGVAVVAHQTRTVPEVLPSVNASLKPVRDFCETIQLNGIDWSDNLAVLWVHDGAGPNLKCYVFEETALQ